MSCCTDGVCQYLVKCSVRVVLLREARGHQIPSVTLEKPTGSGYFWQQGWRALQLHNSRIPTIYVCIPSPSAPTHPISFPFLCLSFQTAHSLCRSVVYCKTDVQNDVQVWAVPLLKLGLQVVILPGASCGDTAL